MTQKMTDLIKQVVAMLMALFMFMGTLGYTFEQFNPTTIEAFGIFLTALVPFGVTIYGIYMNTFYNRKAFDRAQQKEAQRQIEEGEFNPNANKFVLEELDVPAEAEDGADL